MLGLLAATFMVAAGPVEAEAAGPEWRLRSTANTTAEPGGTIEYAVVADNVGDADTDGSAYSLTVTLPPGLTLNDAHATIFGSGVFSGPGGNFDCSSLVVGASTVTCTNTDVMEPGNQSLGAVTVVADVASGITGVRTIEAEIAGGGPAAGDSTVDPTLITDAPAPGFGIEAFDGQVSGDAAGTPYTQAGGHPYAISMQIDVNKLTDPVEGPMWPAGSVKDIIVEAPPGLVGDPLGIGRCTADQLLPQGSAVLPLCPSDSQIGVVDVTFEAGSHSTIAFPVYNMVAPSNVPVRFGINVSGALVTLDASVRSGSDYGVTFSSLNTPQLLAVAGMDITFWGFPADPVHDPQRACAGGADLGCSNEADLTAFLRLPTSCSAPGTGSETRLRVSSWESPTVFDTASFVSHLSPFYPAEAADWGLPIGTDGCETVPFHANLDAEPATPARANQPASFSFDLSIPQGGSPDAIDESDLRKAVVTLPEGVRVSPPSAYGLAGCAPGEIALASDADPQCPDGSKIGSVRVKTPLLEEELKGSVYLATPHDNPSSTLLALYLVVKGPGVIIKLPGSVEANADTGQLTATFDNNPQLPFENLHLELNDGPRAPLVLPPKCGTHTTRAVLTGWSGATRVTDSSFTVSAGSDGKPCSTKPEFTPDLEAGTLSPVAGAFSPFVLTLTRDDADEELRTLEVEMPQGVLARIKGVARCGAVQAVAGTCPADTRVGSVTAGAGAGPSPFFVSGGVFFAGAYKGAPFSLSVVVPVKAGPFDLGNVVVRAAIHIDPKTAELKVVSDPIPSILEGIPLQARVVQVLIDRSRFILNPTSCGMRAVNAKVGSTEGTIANVSSRFRVGDCAALGFRPKLALELTGPKQTKTGKHPGVKATVTQKGIGEAAIKRARVRLPKSLALDPDNARALCEFDDGTKPDLENHCPKASIIGRAKAISPLLDDPLAGNVYFVKNVRRNANGNLIRTLPMLVVALRGEIAINLQGTSSTTRSGQLVNTFAKVPDAPITKFNLNIAGGNNGILTITRTAKNRINLCAKPKSHTATAQINGQNGKRANFNVQVTTPCAKKSKARRRTTAKQLGTRPGPATSPRT